MHQSLDGVTVVLLDIEGTICSISFVKDILFPYALEALPEVLRQKWDDPTFKPYRDAFPAEYRDSPQALQAHVEDLTKQDVKIAYLKNLQGYLWRTGYETHAYATPLYPDVLPYLKQWHSSSKTIAIYSSGSVSAQKLLFAHIKTDTATNPDPRKVTTTEDLTEMVTGWFDTINAGSKTVARSYEEIANLLSKPVGEVLFLSDNVKEVKAALDAGMKSIVVDRPGNAPVSEEERRRYVVVRSFGELGI